MNEPPHPPLPSLPPRGLGWLRFLIWIMPSAIVPMCLFGGAFLRVLPFSTFLGGAAALGLIFYLGHFDALLRCQGLGITRDHPRAAMVSHVWTFVITQIFVVPLIWFMIAWGYCVISGSH